MRKIVVAVALLFAVTSQSQQQSKQNAPPAPVAAPAPLVEKIDVSVVNVDVTVTDRRGQPVPGLTRNDFEILEDGKLQPISNFYVVENAQAKTDVQPGPETEAVPAPSPERFRRKVLVLIDNLNTTPHGRNVALDRLEAFVNDHFDDGRYDWSIATVDTGVHLVLPMTSEKKTLHDVVTSIRHTGTRKAIKAPIDHSEFKSVSAMAKITPRDPDVQNLRKDFADKWVSTPTINMLDDEAAQKDQLISAHSSTEAIVDAARAFGSSEGRKIILLVTGYLPLGTLSPIDRPSYDPAVGGHAQDIVSADRDLNNIARFWCARRTRRTPAFTSSPPRGWNCRRRMW